MKRHGKNKMKAFIKSSAAALLIGASLLAGCGQKKQEGGEQNLYTWEGMIPQEILTGFEEETGIRIR